MRRPFLVILLLLCTSPARPDENLVQGGGFEAGLVAPWGTGAQPAGQPVWWNSGGCSSTAEIDSAGAKSGSRSLHIVNPCQRAPHVYGTAQQPLRVVANRSYRIAVWARANGLASPGSVSLVVDDAWRVRPIQLPAGSWGWRRFEGEFTLPVEAAYLRILSEDRGEVWLDDVVIEALPALPAAPAAGQTTTGAINGSDGEWAFQLHRPVAVDGIIVEYRYEAWNRAGTRRSGRLQLTQRRQRVKMALQLDGEVTVRVFDGMVASNGIVMSGRAYDLPAKDLVHGGTSWWATIEPTRAAGRPNLNTATVGAIAAVLDNPRAAWLVVGWRLEHGALGSHADLGRIAELDARSRRELEANTDVR